MRYSALQQMLGTALLAVTSQAFETEMQQHTAIHENLAQIEVQHLLAGSMGGLEPCETLPSCIGGQFIYRTSDVNADDDCTCRYLPQDCPVENQIFDVTTGTCVCEQRDCLDDFVWDYDSCKCECVHDKACEDGDFWDRDSCQCLCKPEVCPSGSQWSYENCACECIIRTDCVSPTPYFDVEECACKCEPLQCPMGQEFHFDSCGCECMYSECEDSAYYFDTVTCDCLCKPQECGYGFYFNTQECDCLCQDPAEYDTGCPLGEYFSTHHCECECDPTFGGNICQSGFVLDIDTCTCVCETEACTGTKIFNQATCECECCPKICPDNFHWDDVDCECVCSPINCGADRYWNQDDCRCECVFDECLADLNNVYYFNTEECVCKCSHRVAGKECAVGEVFDESICACVTSPSVCASGSHWDARANKCVCNVAVCPEGQYWRIDTDDSALCGCYCKPEYCAVGYHWDEEHCDCVCSEPSNACAAGSHWDSEHCRCLCDPTPCPSIEGVARQFDDELCQCICIDQGNCAASEYFDHETCSCLCAPSEACTEGQYWDTRLCACLADPENCHCAIGFYFDFDEAECKCLPQQCDSGLVWNSGECACECEYDGSCVGSFLGVDYYFDSDSCKCRCYYNEPSDDDHYFDMTDCIEKLKAPDAGCPTINGNAQYWSVTDEVCKCAYQRSTDPSLVFNVDICDFELLPYECYDDSHYWDANLNMCACYTQTCPENHEWNKRMCTCVCIQQECPAGELFDLSCCRCRTCRDQGDCEAGVQFFNPKTCTCTCLPESCTSFGIGWVWSYSTCQCEAPCFEAAAVLAFDATSLATTCAEIEGVAAEFRIATCECVPASTANPCAVGSVDYDPFNINCAIATGGVHGIGCEIWLNCNTDLDARIVNVEGAQAVVTLSEGQASGDICLNDSGEQYIVTKQLMGSQGQIPIDNFYFAEDRNGNGNLNIPLNGTLPNYPSEDYIYYLYMQSADRVQWGCQEWLSVKESDCADPTNKRVDVQNFAQSDAVEMKIQLYTDINDGENGTECVYWTIEINSIRGQATACQGAKLDIVSDTTIIGAGTEELYWTRDPSVYDGLFDISPIPGFNIPHKFRHRFRFDHMTDQGMFVLPEGAKYCPQSFNETLEE